MNPPLSQRANAKAYNIQIAQSESHLELKFVPLFPALYSGLILCSLAVVITVAVRWFDPSPFSWSVVGVTGMAFVFGVLTAASEPMRLTLDRTEQRVHLSGRLLWKTRVSFDLPFNEVSGFALMEGSDIEDGITDVLTLLATDGSRRAVVDLRGKADTDALMALERINALLRG
jgi:hypothetical protein